jgi:hypothetical protein
MNSIKLEQLTLSILVKMKAYQDSIGFSYNISPDAPDTYERLKAESTIDNLIVWDGASDQAIWGIAGNYLFRAVHDYIHLKHNLSFSDEHEKKVYHATCAELGLDDNERVVMFAEIVGQLEYKNIYGNFPENQLGFVLGSWDNLGEKVLK